VPEKRLATDVTQWCVLYRPAGSYTRCVLLHESQNVCDEAGMSLWEEAFAGDEVLIMPAVYADGSTHPQYLQALANNEMTDLN
jgi:hypothetical protein